MSKGIDIATTGDVTAREDEGTAVHICDESGQAATYDNDRPVTIRVAGSYSKAYRRRAEAQTQRMFKRRQGTLNAEQWQQNRIELVAACVMSWEGFVNNGQPFPCTKENAVLMLTRAPWILTQLEEAQADHAGFFKGASAS